MNGDFFNLEWCDYDSVLNVRDSDVLAAITEEDLRSFTFDGLKRRLGMHSETLSRVLARLEVEGYVKKTKEGYEVAPNNHRVLNLNVAQSEKSCVTLVRTFLPSDVSTDRLTLDLRGRWFGLLRWLGMGQTDDGIAMKWVTENGDVQVDAKIAESTLTIEAKFLHRHDSDLALRAAYQLITHIGKLCTRTPKPVARPVAYFAGYPSFMTTA